MAINFHLLIATAEEAGARDRFQKLVADLVRVQQRTVREIRPSPGDWGIDVFIGELDGVISVWQAKFFIAGVDATQQQEIRDSLKAVMTAAEREGFAVDAWTLCIPTNMGPKATKWWDGWKKRQEKKYGIRVVLWDETELRALLRSPDAARVREAYFPSPAPSVPAPRAVEPLPAPDIYDDMLFIAQLKAGEIAELESAKVQFFNADLLTREVADKGVEEEMGALATVRAEVHAIWETRFNAKCSEKPVDPLFPGLHSQVMLAIEQLHSSGRPLLLPMSLVHRLGSMHQVVEYGAAGWVLEFRKIAEGYGR